MKKINQVFELPLSQLPEADDQIQDANEDWALIVRLPWRTSYVINSINHVDALADALDALLARCAHDGIINADTAVAEVILASYRGGINE